MQLMHRAPVIDLTVVDGSGVPVHSNPVTADGKPLNGGAGDRNSPASSHHFLIVRYGSLFITALFGVRG